MQANQTKEPAVDVTQPASANAISSTVPAPHTDEDRAASKIQALARGQIVRQHQKDQRLWQVWNELDWKEEAELMSSHQAYEDLKASLKKKKEEELETKQPAEAASPTTTDTSPTSTETKLAIDSSESKVDSSDEKTPPSASSNNSSNTPAATTSTPSSPSPKTYLIRTKSLARPSKTPEEIADDKKKLDDGLNLTEPIQLDFVTAMMDHFKFNNRLDLENVVELLRRVKAVLKAQPNVVDLNITTRLTVVGDLHGQLDDLFAIFKLNGLPSPRNAYLFNGDFVDRGQYSCECVLTLFAFKLLYPKSMHLNRGNHEARDINSRDGFERECLEKYNHAVFDLFSDVFSCLPLGAVLNKQILVVHGGLSRRDFTIADLQGVDRFHEIPPTDSLMEDIIWSDPDTRLGRRSSPRGAGQMFGADVTAKFLKDNQLKLIIRSHECMQKGYELHHNDSVITVFSASNYTGTVNNEGAFIIFERDLIPRIVPFFAKPKERLSRYRMRHAVLENDIIAKLLQRIADHRLALTDWYRTIEIVTPNGIHTVTRLQWAEGLKTILKLNIPFLEFQDYLGLPKLGVDGRKKSEIDYMAFLLRFRPVNAFLDNLNDLNTNDPSSSSPTSTTRGVSENVEAIIEMLQKNRYELESLFRHFDLNGDEHISVSEFKEGLSSLSHILGFKFAETDIDSLLHHIDTDHDGHISYTEFFASFRMSDPILNQPAEKKNAFLKANQRQTGSEIKPDQTPSPVVTPRTLDAQKKMTE